MYWICFSTIKNIENGETSMSSDGSIDGRLSRGNRGVDADHVYTTVSCSEMADVVTCEKVVAD